MSPEGAAINTIAATLIAEGRTGAAALLCAVWGMVCSNQTPERDMRNLANTLATATLKKMGKRT